MKARRPLFDFIENIKVIIKTKIDAGKTPRSVSQLWISANFSKNQHAGHTVVSQIYSFF